MPLGLNNVVAHKSDLLANATDARDVRILADAISNMLNQASGTRIPSYDGIRIGIGRSEGVSNKTLCKQGGLAIDPYSAAQCVTSEPLRTQQFIKGVRAAIQKKLDESDKPIHLLYAGTGPFAPLITTSLHMYDPRRLRVHFMDIHKFSVESVRAVVETLGYSDFAEEITVEDATSCQLGYAPDILVTETMQSGLQREPQYWICRNLFPQMDPKGIVVPEKVEVNLLAYNGTSRHTGRRTVVGNVVSVSHGGDFEVNTEFDMPSNIGNVNRGFLLGTEIKVGHGLLIHPGQSKITEDVVINGKSQEDRINLIYKPGGKSVGIL
jgi:hypothetical protein